jgi:hypothetical protein
MFIKNPMIKFYVISGVILLMFAVIFAALLTPRTSGCRSKNCKGEINIYLMGLPSASPFTVTISFPSGETRSVTCGDEGADKTSSFYNRCLQAGVSFGLDENIEMPGEINVVVDADGKHISKVFDNPPKMVNHPNGDDCLPVCYSTSFLIDVSQ